MRLLKLKTIFKKILLERFFKSRELKYIWYHLTMPIVDFCIYMFKIYQKDHDSNDCPLQIFRVKLIILLRNSSLAAYHSKANTQETSVG